MERWVAMYLLRYTVVTVHRTVQKPLERDRRLNLYRHFCVLMDRDAYYSPRWLRSRSSGRGSGVNIPKGLCMARINSYKILGTESAVYWVEWD